MKRIASIEKLIDADGVYGYAILGESSDGGRLPKPVILRPDRIVPGGRKAHDDPILQQIPPGFLIKHKSGSTEQVYSVRESGKPAATLAITTRHHDGSITPSISQIARPCNAPVPSKMERAARRWLSRGPFVMPERKQVINDDLPDFMQDAHGGGCSRCRSRRLRHRSKIPRERFRCVPSCRSGTTNGGGVG